MYFVNNNKKLSQLIFRVLLPLKASHKLDMTKQNEKLVT